MFSRKIGHRQDTGHRTRYGLHRLGANLEQGSVSNKEQGVHP